MEVKQQKLDTFLLKFKEINHYILSTYLTIIRYIILPYILLIHYLT